MLLFTYSYMEQIRELSQVVTLVTIPRYLPVIMWPQYGDYKNPYVRKTIPCEKRNGKYFDLRSGQPVVKTDTMLEWNNLSGSYFRYPDGHELLVSRRIADKQLLLMAVHSEFNPTTMFLRQVVDRKEKEEQF